MHVHRSGGGHQMAKQLQHEPMSAHVGAHVGFMPVLQAGWCPVEAQGRHSALLPLPPVGPSFNCRGTFQWTRGQSVGHSQVDLWPNGCWSRQMANDATC